MTEEADGRRVAAAELEAWSTALFEAAGMVREEAAVAAGILVRTSLRGIDTHGVSRVPLYAESLIDGGINPRPAHGGEHRDGVLFYRGDHGLGQAVGAAAMRSAVAIAATTPVVPCLLYECGHLAALGAYVLLAAEDGMFAFICQATTPLMGLPGWTGRGIGNNPLAFASPLPGHPPLVFDMASSVVARGHLRQAVREKTPIPDDWAIGPDGRPTTDPEIGMQGAVLPVGGYKGIGIAMLVQCLAGSLLGSSAKLAGPGAGAEMCAFMLVINPKLAAGGVYDDDMTVWFARYVAAAGPDGRYPGRRAAESEARRRREGIPVPPGALAHMTKVGERLGVPFPA